MLLDKLKSKGHRGWYSLTSHFRSEHKPAAVVDGNLFPLPLELVEEIALYFTRSEALRVLAVNSVFHHVFSRVVWLEVHLGDWNANLIPKSAWKKYGHLIRVAAVALKKMHKLSVISMHKLSAISMPNLVKLDLHLGGDAYRLFEHAELPHLRRLYMSLAYDKWTRADFEKGVELAQRLKRTGQPVEVGWDVYARKDDDLSILDEILGLVDDTTFDSIVLIITSVSGPVVTLSHLPKLALLLKRISFTDAKVFDSIFGGDTSLIFPQLELLKLDGTSLVDYSIGPDIITPQRLPALKKLHLCTLKRVDQTWISSLIGSNTWSNLTELYLCCCSDDFDFEAVAARIPNLEHLTLSRCFFRLEITTIAPLLPRLEHLILGDLIKFGYNTTQYPQVQLASLKSLIFEFDIPRDGELNIPFLLIHFILCGAPNLESLGVNGCVMSMDDLKTRSDHANPSVRIIQSVFASQSIME
ncbi:hypothetical protein GQ42DRAFT_170655 [Ramicandelaber brevisporus]|nr:hypothetical protein GQ42DRAFT_170655 [Ramicandelaber brevisporus]